MAPAGVHCLKGAVDWFRAFPAGPVQTPRNRAERHGDGMFRPLAQDVSTRRRPLANFHIGGRGDYAIAFVRRNRDADRASRDSSPFAY